MNGTPSAQKAPAAARPGAARRRSPKGEEARARILQIAIESFAERGYHGTSINEIAKAAGITMPGLLHHFPNKRELFAAMLSEQDRRDTALFASFFPDDAGVFEVLDAFVEMARVNRGRFGVVQLFHLLAIEAAPGDHPYSARARDHFREARGYVADGVRRSIARGEVRADVDPDRIGTIVVAMVEGLENQWLHEPESIDVAESFRMWADGLSGRLRA